jgi:Ca2+-binding RTX toxin-like protein
MTQFYFTQAQIDVIRGYQQRGPNAAGNYSDFYDYVAGILPASGEQRWFQGAAQANAGTGAMSAMIREYTKRQLLLRGLTIVDAEMQTASNAVATNVLADILDSARQQPDGTWLAPSIEDIARNDATAVGEVLFQALPEGDTARSNNAGWSGALLFSPLGSDQTFRLLGAGAAGVLDKLDDAKNVLFAVDSFYAGFRAALDAVIAEIGNLTTLVISPTDSASTRSFKQLCTDVGITIEIISDNLGEAAVTSKLTTILPSEAREYLKAIENFGAAAVLDMLRTTYTGAPLADTSNENFAANAAAFFQESSIANSRQQSLNVELTVGATASELSSLALSSAPYRNALAGLSIFVLDLTEDELASRQLDVYDTATGTGYLSREWIADRSSFLIWKMYRAENGIEGVITRQPVFANATYTDVALASTIRIGAVDDSQRRQFFFGDSQANSFQGFGLSDHLYGGSGDDNLGGLGGDDRIEGAGGSDTIDGGAGKDTLLGGAGADTMLGGEDDDDLAGGAGDDTLDGGTGKDTYRWFSGDGSDTISDSDKNGRIFVNGKFVRDLLKVGTTYVSPDGTVSATRESALTLTTTDGATLEIANFQDLDEGLLVIRDAGGADDVPTAFIDGTVFDDNNSTIDGQSHPSLSGTDQADLIHGLQGNDNLMGAGGEDELYGDEGDDQILGELGNDSILGGADSDILLGQGGDDYVYADAVVALPDAIAAGEGSAGTIREFEGGGTGNDILISSTGNDALSGGDGIDIIVGGAGNDVIWGDAELVADSPDWDLNGFVHITGFIPAADVGGADAIYAGAGDDQVAAEGGDDYVDGGSGNDQISGHGGSDTLFGGAGDDVISGDALDGDQAHPIPDNLQGDDYIDGEDGNDQLVGAGGADIVFGGAGDDLLLGDDNITPLAIQGNDYLDGEDGNDQLYGYAGADEMFGGAGIDVLVAGDGDDYLDGESEADELYGDAGADTLFGGAGLDLLRGGDGDDYLDGEEDDDQIAGDGGSDVLFGGAGNDTITGSDGDDFIDGEDGNDFVDAGVGNDVLIGGLGDDELQGWDGDDSLDGGDGVDRLFGLAGVDTLSGGLGNDSLVGGAGADTLDGGDDDDQLFGDADDVAVADQGADTISGGAGNDTLQGGGADDQLFGDDGGDTVFGEAGNDHVEGGLGDDFLYGDVDIEAADDGADTLLGGDGNDQLVGAGGADILDGGAGVDLLIGGTGDDQFTGGDGDDELQGDSGNDTLAGGTGNDTLFGDAGSDIYLFNAGDGHDLVSDDAAIETDILRFGEAITQGDLTFSRVAGDLVIDLANGADQVTVLNWYTATTGYQMTRLEFADGSTLSGATVTNLGLQAQSGTSGNDTLSGTGGNDKLYGLGGDDTIFGNGGDDLLVGGLGNDVLSGGDGANTYRVELGDGQDHIQESGFVNDTLIFGAGIPSSDLSYRRIGNDLAMSNANGTDKVTVDGWYTAGTFSFQLQTVRFESDGTVLTTSQLSTLGTVIDDQYTYTAGSGAVTIEDWGGTDALTFSAGIAKADIAPSRVGQDLVLSSTAVAGDKVTIKDWFTDVTKQVENVNFAATGETFVHSELTDPFLTLSGTAGADALVGGNAYGEAINGLDGNDTINGGGGDDLITGGLGNDTIDGGDGTDRYFFKPGDGQDFISDSDGFVDVLQFGPGMVNNLVVSPVGQDTLITFTGSSDSVRLHVTGSRGIASKFELNGTDNDDTITGSQFGDVIQGLGGNDSINGANGADEIHGGAGDDTLEGGGSDTDPSFDWLYGEDGNDILDGGFRSSASDVTAFFTGGRGNDQLFGGSSTDHYYFNLGDGADTITDEPLFANGSWIFSPEDEIIFGAGITKDSISARFSGSDLIIQVTASDSITVKSWNGMSRVEFLRFAGGTSMDPTQINDLALTLKGTSGDDTLTGTSANETLLGLAGNDTLLGMAGDDKLTGAVGNDSVQGGDGNDSYFFNVGDGQDVVVETTGTDTVQFGAGITASGITLTRDVNSLVLWVNGTSDSVKITDYLTNFNGRIENFVFPDGSQLPTAAEIFDQLVVMQGTAGDDTLTGSAGHDQIHASDGNDTLFGMADFDWLFGEAGNDTLVGGTGNDNLYGDTGDDVYQYAVGDGQDTINDTSGFDQLIFGSGIGTAAVTMMRDASNLFLNIGVAGNPGAITVLNYFSAQETEQIKFSDGAIWDVATVRARLLAASQTSGSDTVYGYETGDAISSLAGDDTVYGRAGNDTIDGGTGSDTLYGEDGDDVINAGTGDAKNASVVNFLYGGNGNDVLIASGKPDQLFGGAGNDIYHGGTAVEVLEDTGGNNVMDALAGDDTLRGGDGNDAFIGGAGNDAIDGDFDGNGSRGSDIVLFNKGAGTDTVTRLGSGSTLSMGGGMLYSNLGLSASGNSLVVSAGTGTVSFTDWYSGNKAVSKLQIVIEGTRDYSATSPDPMKNKKIQTFDFTGLVNAFDAARAAGQTLNVANSLAAYRLSGSDTDAIGGAIAYQYNKNGSISTISDTQLKGILASSNFAVNPQSIDATAPQSLSLAPASTQTGASDAETMDAGTFSLAAATTTFTSDNSQWSETMQQESVNVRPEGPVTDLVAQQTQALIDRWFERAEERQVVKLSQLEEVSQGVLGKTPSGPAPERIAEQWSRGARSLPVHFAEYADVGTEGGFMLAVPVVASQRAAQGIGLARETGTNLKPLEGLSEGFALLR